MRLKVITTSLLGIAAEIGYALTLILAAFFICILLSGKI